MLTKTCKTRPRNCTPDELAKVGVVLLDKRDIRLGCMKYGRKWCPMLGREGRLARGYCRCYGGCNADSSNKRSPNA